jgi:hypothetical protein
MSLGMKLFHTIAYSFGPILQVVLRPAQIQLLAICHKDEHVSNMCPILGDIHLLFNLLDIIGDFILSLTALIPPSHLQQA